MARKYLLLAIGRWLLAGPASTSQQPVANGQWRIRERL